MPELSWSTGVVEIPSEVDDRLMSSNHHIHPGDEEASAHVEAEASESTDESHHHAKARRFRVPFAHLSPSAVSKWKRETRFGIAVVLSFVILVTTLIMNKGKDRKLTMNLPGPAKQEDPKENAAKGEKDQEKEKGTGTPPEAVASTGTPPPAPAESKKPEPEAEAPKQEPAKEEGAVASTKTDAPVTTPPKEEETAPTTTASAPATPPADVPKGTEPTANNGLIEMPSTVPGAESNNSVASADPPKDAPPLPPAEVPAEKPGAEAVLPPATAPAAEAVVTAPTEGGSTPIPPSEHAPVDAGSSGLLAAPTSLEPPATNGAAPVASAPNSEPANTGGTTPPVTTTAAPPAASVPGNATAPAPELPAAVATPPANVTAPAPAGGLPAAVPPAAAAAATAIAAETIPSGAAPDPMQVKPSEMPNLTPPPSGPVGTEAEAPKMASTSSQEVGNLTPIPNAGQARFPDEGSSPTETATTTPVDQSAPATVEQEDRIEPIPHVVKSGENYWTISRLYYDSGRYYKALWKANSDLTAAPEDLAVGMTIKIPPPESLDRSLIIAPQVGRSSESTARASVQQASGHNSRSVRKSGTVRKSSEVDLALPTIDPFYERRMKPQPPAEEEDSQEPAGVNLPLHRVRRGETLRTIARDYLGSARRASEIYELNRHSLEGPNDKLVTGQTLSLPEDARTAIRSR